jgi:hypothetical protein
VCDSNLGWTLCDLDNRSCAAMEVHISNVPPQSTENGLKNFLRPFLARLSIRAVNCHKQRYRPFASLTFLHVAEGERFLHHHGQVRAFTNGRPMRMSVNSVNLRFLGRPIYCEKGNRDPNPYLLRVLRKEEKDRQLQPMALSTTDHGKSDILPVEFDCLMVSCGVWTYVGLDLVFAPQHTWTVNGKAKFGRRSMILSFRSGLRIDFLYSSTIGITAEEGSTPSFILSMQEPPRFFEKISDPITDLMDQLSITGAQIPRNLVRKNVPQRHRLPCLDDKHQPIAGSCLVYRVVIKQDHVTYSLGDSSVGDLMQSLRKAHGMPAMIHQRTRLHQLVDSWANQFRRLEDSLSSLSIGLPFEVSFQIQKLAQGAYLLPRTVQELLPEIQAMNQRSTAVCVKAIRKLFNQIPFPGPETEAHEFQHQALVDLLRDNEEQAKREALSLYEEERASENVAIIHRAKITPTGIYLFGPEPESNNRVLRKYPDHHEYFLRVQFCDEDGQPVRFNPRSSNKKIFHERFKKILEDGISIAGRRHNFLGFSHSSLRAQSCWFMAPFIFEGSLMYDRMIIQDLGNFTVIRSPAKCAARIGQAFSDTRTAIPIDPNIVREMGDVETDGRVFSDGVGTMSSSVMEKIWEGLSKKALSKPTCFQIRYRGE